MATSAELTGTLNMLSGLHCSICLGSLTEPKNLNCAHTFCLSCLKRLLKYKVEYVVIVCPLCREDTIVPEGKVENLKTNLAIKSVVEDVQNLEGKCDTCGRIGRSKILYLCYDCATFMCSRCKKAHDDDEEKSSHKVQKEKRRSISQTALKYPGCSNHPDEKFTELCNTCKKIVCKKCKEDHSKCKHQTVSTIDYLSELYAKIPHLQEQFRVTSVKCRDAYLFGLQNEEKTKAAIDKLLNEVNVEYNLSITKLNEGKSLLENACKDLMDQATKQKKALLRNMQECATVVKDTFESTDNILQSPFKDISLHEPCLRKHTDRITEIRRKTADTGNILFEIYKNAKQLHLTKRNVHHIGNPIGSIEFDKWNRQDIPLSSDTMTSTAVRHDGKVAVGYLAGGVEIITENGSEGTILNDEQVLAMAWFNNGDLALRDSKNKITLYNKELVRSQTCFETLGQETGGDGDIAINISSSNIFVSYRKIVQIHVFSKKGGNKFRVISCVPNIPQQICITGNSNIVIMNASVITTVDTHGNPLSEVTKPGYFGYPACKRDGSILVTWVKQNGQSPLVIERYKRSLSPNSTDDTVFVDSFDMPNRHDRMWYRLEVPTEDKIFFCSPNCMYFFQRRKETLGNELSTLI